MEILMLIAAVASLFATIVNTLYGIILVVLALQQEG